MTYPYPQQDPYNQGGYQPDPYNQGGYPQTGGFPQQGYPQQGYPQQGGGFPPGGPPGPPKSNTTLIVSIVAVVVLVLGALGITGFVAPGFFLADDKKDSENGGNNGAGPDDLAQAIVTGLNNKDANALNAIKCADATPSVLDVIEDVSSLQSAQLAGPVRTESDTRAVADVTFSATTPSGTETGTASGVMANQNGKWCWQDVNLGGSLPGGSTSPSVPSIPSTGAPPPIDPSGGATGGPGGGQGSSDLNSLMESFLSAVNSGDLSSATAVMCSDGDTAAAQDAIDRKVNLSLEEAPDDKSTFSIGDLKGTEGSGENLIGSLDATRDDSSSPWCIEDLRLY